MRAAAAALLLSGACRVVAGMARELQQPMFAPVAQARPHRVVGKLDDWVGTELGHSA